MDRRIDPGRTVVGEVVVGEVHDLRPHEREAADKTRVTTEGEARVGVHRAPGKQRRLQVDVGHVGVFRVVRGGTEGPQDVVMHVDGRPGDAPGRDDVAGAGMMSPVTSSVRTNDGSAGTL